jgi:hypothetical protein
MAVKRQTPQRHPVSPTFAAKGQGGIDLESKPPELVSEAWYHRRIEFSAKFLKASTEVPSLSRMAVELRIERYSLDWEPALAIIINRSNKFQAGSTKEVIGCDYSRSVERYSWYVGEVATPFQGP